MHHVLAASLQMHEAAKHYYPMTSYDKKTAEQAGIFAGCVGGFLVLVSMFKGGRRRPATS